MKCAAVRRALGAEPGITSAEIDAHVADCADCAAFRREMLDLDDRIAQALALPIAMRAGASGGAGTRREAAGLTSRRDVAVASRRPSSGRAWALAASMLLAVAIGLFVVGDRQGEALAADVVGHLAGETESWGASRPVPQSALDLALRRTGVRLERAALGDVVYAHACFFRGRWVPHLVVRTAQGPVTVMVLRHEQVETAQHFEEDGYAGVIAPVPGGAVAILGLGPLDFDEPLRRVHAALGGPDRGAERS